VAASRFSHPTRDLPPFLHGNVNLRSQRSPEHSARG
jgi:hypothetical protein